MKRMILLNEDSQRAANEIRAFAERIENWYRPTTEEYADKGAKGNPRRPGNDPRYCVVISGILCIYSLDESPQALIRHLSLKRHDAEPDTILHPAVAQAIGGLFGFTPKAQVSADECRPPCSNVLEPIEFYDKALKESWEAGRLILR